MLLDYVSLSVAHFRNLLSAHMCPESLVATVRRNYKLALGYPDEEIEAPAADPRIADLLAIPRRDPLLRIREVIYSTQGKAVIYALGFYRSDRHNLVIRRFR